MRTAGAVLVTTVALIVSTAACSTVEEVQQGVEDEVRQEADDEVDRLRTQAEDRVDRLRTQTEDRVQEGVDELEGR